MKQVGYLIGLVASIITIFVFATNISSWDELVGNTAKVEERNIKDALPKINSNSEEITESFLKSNPQQKTKSSIEILTSSINELMREACEFNYSDGGYNRFVSFEIDGNLIIVKTESKLGLNWSTNEVSSRLITIDETSTIYFKERIYELLGQKGGGELWFKNGKKNIYVETYLSKTPNDKNVSSLINRTGVLINYRFHNNKSKMKALKNDLKKIINLISIKENNDHQQ